MNARRRFESLLRRVPPDRDGVARIGARQIYILPTATGLLYAGVLLLMLLGSLNYQNNLGLLFTFFMAAVGLVAMHHAWFNLLGLSVQARGGPPVFAGETALFTLTLGEDARRGRHDIRVNAGSASVQVSPTADDGLQSGKKTQMVKASVKARLNADDDTPQSGKKGQTGQASVQANLNADDRLTLALNLPTVRRGRQPLGELVLETRHPMRLFRAWCLVSTTAATLVYPRPARFAPPPERAAGTDRRQAPASRHGESGAEDYLGQRDYRHGDSPRHIDWKALARERGLLVKQFGGAQGQEAWIDWFALDAPDPETRLALLTRQVLDADAAGIRFGLRLPGLTEPLAAGAGHTQRCLTHLALFDHARAPDSSR